MNPKNIFNIVKKELRTYFDSPTAYIVIILFLFLWEFLFFRDVFIVGEASLRILMSYLPWLLLILIPALTMGSISSEKSEGTLEFLLTQPLRIIELILGKFVAALMFVMIALLYIVPLSISLNQYGSLDWGVVAGQFLGSLLLAAVFISIGIAVSSFLKSQIASLLVSTTISFFLIIIGLEIVTLSVPSQVSAVLEQVSVLTRFGSISRGVIDLRDLWYFATVIILGLSIAYLQILKIRIGNRRELYRTYATGVLLFAGIAALITVIGARFPYRLDLTQGKMYQLTPATVETLTQLDDVVNIKLYSSQELPAQLRPILRDTKDILSDYETYGNGNIRVTIENPSANPSVANEANSLGIREVQFNVIGQEELQLKKGYLGLAVLYGGETETIPLISNTADLEYQLTSFIRKLTTDEKKTVAFLTGHGEKSTSANYQTWSTELEKLFAIEEVTLDEDSTIPEHVSTLVVAGTSEPVDEATREKLANYFNAGGSLLMLIDAITVQDGLLSASVNPNSLADFVATFGVTVGQDIVYDVRSSEMVTFGGDGTSFVMQYPFWPRAMAVKGETPITSRINTLVMPWPSSVETNETLTELGFTATELFTTSEFGSKQVGSFNLSPDQQLLPTDVSSIPLAMSVIGDETEDGKVPRMIVVGDSDFLADQYVTATPENLAFGIEAASWLSQEQSLAEIQLKQRSSNQLLFQNQSQISLVKYGNLALAVVLPLIIGSVRLVRRRSLRNLSYSQANE